MGRSLLGRSAALSAVVAAAALAPGLAAPNASAGPATHRPATDRSYLHRHADIIDRGKDAHGLTVYISRIGDPSRPFGGMRVYVTRGKRPAGTAKRPPRSAHPVFSCRGAAAYCPRSHQRTFGGLRQFRRYTVTVFDTDGRGHWTRDVATAPCRWCSYPYRRGTFLAAPGGERRLDRGVGYAQTADVPRHAAALVRAANGDQAVLAAGNGRLVYRTRRHGEASWHRQPVATAGSPAGCHSVMGYADQAGRTVLWLVLGCHGHAWYRIAPVHARRIGAFAQVPTFVDGDGNAMRIMSATAAPNAGYLLLESNDWSQHVPQAEVVHVSAAGAFVPEASQPAAGTSDAFATTIARDPRSGTVVIGGGSDDTGAWAWSRDAGQDWGPPVEVANPGDNGQTVTTAAAARGKLYLGWAAPSDAVPPHGRSRPAGIYVAGSSRGGTWDRPQHVTHTHGADSDPMLAVNPVTGNPHVVFSRADAADPHHGSGVFHTAYDHSKWSHRRFLSHWISDAPESFVLDGHAHPVVLFARF